MMEEPAYSNLFLGDSSTVKRLCQKEIPFHSCGVLAFCTTLKVNEISLSIVGTAKRKAKAIRSMRVGIWKMTGSFFFMRQVLLTLGYGTLSTVDNDNTITFVAEYYQLRKFCGHFRLTLSKKNPWRSFATTFTQFHWSSRSYHIWVLCQGHC